MYLWVYILIAFLIIAVLAVSIYFLTKLQPGSLQPPSSVMIFDAVTVGTSRRLTWLPSSGSAPIGYVYTITSVTNSTPVEGGDTMDTFVVLDGPNFVAGQQYKLTVIAKNNIGQSEPSTFVFTI